jgi:hypothetical protein
LEEAELKIRIFSDHQNLTYFRTANSLNRRQARWAEELKPLYFEILYREGSANVKANTFSRCPVFTSRDGGTPSALNQRMLSKDRWLEIGALEVDQEVFQNIDIGAIEVELLLPEAKERNKQKALLDEKYLEICRRVHEGKAQDDHFTIADDLLCWKKRIYVPKKLRTRIIESENVSKVAGHFGRARTLELVYRNFYLVNMERDVRKYC